MELNDVETELKTDSIDGNIISYMIEPRSRNGLLSFQYSLSIVTESKRKVVYFVKSSRDLSPKGASIFHVDEDIFSEEVCFLKYVYPLLREYLKGCTPECLFVNNNKLVFQDIQSLGFFNPIGFLNQEQLIEAVRLLANFHASSIIVEKKSGYSLKERFPHYFREKFFLDHVCFGEQHVSRLLDVVLNFISGLVKYFNYDNFVMSVAKNELISTVIDNKKLTVICHGDLWGGNFMFTEDGRGYLVDYQLLRYASLGCDLSMLIYLNVQGNVNAIEDVLINIYHTKLAHILMEFGCDASIFENVKQVYNKHRIVGSFYRMVFFPSFLCESVLKDLLSDDCLLKRYLFEDRLSIFLPKIKEDVVLSNSLKCILDDFLHFYNE